MQVKLWGASQFLKWTAMSTGSSFASSLWDTWSTSATWVDVRVADFNGDGKADLTGRYLEGGVWFRIQQGIRGLLVPDERGLAVVYMICEPASHYYQVMTRSRRMPVLIEQRI